MKMRLGPAMVLGLLITFAPFFAGMIVGFTGGLGAPITAEEHFRLSLLSIAVAFAAGCIVSWMVKLPLTLPDYVWTVIVTVGTSSQRLLKAHDVAPEVVFLGICLAAAFVGAMLAARTRALS